MAKGLLGFFGKLFNPILDPVFRPLLSLPPALSIIIITFIITLIMVLIYKKFTDQEVLKSLREEMKQIQKEMKEFQHDTTKVMELQKKSLEKAGKQFRHSMKPMLITMIPILILFGWLSANLAYYPIEPGHEFNTTMVFREGFDGEVKLSASEGIEILNNNTQIIKEKTIGRFFKRKIGEVIWNLKAIEGKHQLGYEFEDKIYVKDVLVTNAKKYEEPETIINDGIIEKIKLSNEPIKVFGLSWFWAYLVLAMVFNALLRKLFKVH